MHSREYLLALPCTYTKFLFFVFPLSVYVCISDRSTIVQFDNQQSLKLMVVIKC